jgi:Cu(I)/Ag(I) efflux system membrane fusion protein
MPLAKITLNKNQLDIVKLSPEQMKLANVKVDSLRISSIGRETIITGIFAVNQNRTSQISARVNGRIEKLYHKISGEEIRTGEPAFDLFSRDLIRLQEEYLLVLSKPEMLGGKAILNASKNKLLLLGMIEKQIDELEKTKQAKTVITIYSTAAGTITGIPVREGDIVNEGTPVYEVADLNSLWVEAQTFPEESAIVAEGKKVEIIPEAFPEEATEGTISFAAPELQSGSKVNLVRAEVNNPGGKFKPGMQANVILHSEEKKAIVLPVDAVIRDSKHALVWIQNKEDGFEMRMVETGIETKFRIEITSGLTVGERVVVSGAYLVNSEYIFKRGMMPMENMPGMEMNNNKDEMQTHQH